MYYNKWDTSDITYLSCFDGIASIFTEVDTSGNICREIGFDEHGSIIHKYPSKLFKYGSYGIFDGQKVIIEVIKNVISKDEFEIAWNSN